MYNRLLLKFVRIWWEGFKVFCRWGAFYIVLLLLFLPATGLIVLVGDRAGHVLALMLFVVIAPVIFYLTSKYLLLLGDGNPRVADDEKGSPHTGTGSNRRMRDKIVISTVVAFCISFWLSLPDAVTALVLGVGAALLCGAVLLILAGSHFIKTSSRSSQAVICIMVCILSVLPFHARSLYRMAGHIDWPAEFSSGSSSSSFRVGNLWILQLSHHGNFWSGKTKCVICSVDSPAGLGTGLTLWLTFSDGNSVEVDFEKNETVWIDKDHKATSLGAVLSEDDVSLLRKCRFDEKLKISSPEQLLALVKKLRAKRAASTAPPKAAG
jgi:hypothetical protein